METEAWTLEEQNVAGWETGFGTWQSPRQGQGPWCSRGAQGSAQLLQVSSLPQPCTSRRGEGCPVQRRSWPASRGHAEGSFRMSQSHSWDLLKGLRPGSQAAGSRSCHIS